MKRLPLFRWWRNGWIAVLLFAVLVPFLPLALRTVALDWQWPQLFPSAVGSRAWDYVFSQSARTSEAVINSLLIASAVTLLNLCAALPAARALVRYSFSGKWLVEALLYAPLFVPPFVSVMGMHMTMIRIGWTDSFAGVIVSHIAPSFPYMLRALTIGYRTLDRKWEDQGRLLGAGWFSRLRAIVFPFLLPAVVAGISLSMLVSLSQYLITFLIGGGKILTLPLLLFPFISGGDPAVGAAFAFVFIAMAVGLMWGMNGLLNRFYRLRLDA